MNKNSMKSNGCIMTVMVTIFFYIFNTTISWVLWNNLCFIFNLPQLTWVQMAALSILMQSILNKININYNTAKRNDNKGN